MTHSASNCTYSKEIASIKTLHELLNFQLETVWKLFPIEKICLDFFGFSCKELFIYAYVVNDVFTYNGFVQIQTIQLANAGREYSGMAAITGWGQDFVTGKCCYLFEIYFLS